MTWTALALAIAGCGEPSNKQVFDEGGMSHDLDEDWYGSVQRGIAATEYAFREDSAGIIGTNRAQGFATRWSNRGTATVSARDGQGSLKPNLGGFELTVSTVAWGRDTTSTMQRGAHRIGPCRPDGEVDARGDCLRRVELAHAGLVEWWENRPEGLEQGWDIGSRIPGDGPLAIDVAIAGMDVIVSPDVATLSGAGATLRYGSVRAWDVDGRAQDAWLEPWAGGVRVRVDDSGASYPLTVDPLITNVAWTAEADQIGAFFGYQVASAGDVNGDGFGDVLVGAYLFDNGEVDEGAAFLYLGSSAGLAAVADWSAESDQDGAQFGFSVASAGDVNGDGFADVIIGANAFDNGENDEGGAFLYLGSPAGLSTAPDWSVESDQVGSGFGVSVASAGDTNGDGFADVLVGANKYDGGEYDEGAAFLFLGSPAGPSTAPDWWVESDQIDAQVGVLVASAGDVNGDGFADVTVGSSFYDNGEGDEGAAFVFHGSAGGPSSSPDWTAEIDQPDARFGQAIASPGSR